MDFNNTKAIYLQIVDWMFERILTGDLKPGDKVKSVREMAVAFEVNPNTVMRSYEFLQNNEIIVNKRGIGSFVSEDAVVKIKKLRQREFMEEEIPAFIKQIKLLDIDVNEIINLLNK